MSYIGGVYGGVCIHGMCDACKWQRGLLRKYCMKFISNANARAILGLRIT